MLQDLRYGLIMLRKNLGFTAAAVLTLGLGVGANTAIFSVIHTFLLKPLPYADSGRVAFVLGWNTAKDEMRFNMSSADFFDLRAKSDALAGLAAYNYWSANLTGGDRPERVQAYQTTPNTFSLLGVEPLHGRVFVPGETGDQRVMLMSHGLWQRRFGADPDVVGQSMTLDGRGYTVIGVMPPSFEFPILNWKGDLWVPFTEAELRDGAERANAFSVVAIGRLRPDVALRAAQSEVDAVMTRFAADFPDTNTGVGVRVIPMQEMLSGQLRPAFLVVFAAVTLVLLIACANVANLLLARAIARGRELAVRTALGASAGRLIRQLLAESLLLSLLGGAVGVGLAYWMLKALVAALPEMVLMSMPGVHEMGLDGPTLIFALAASLSTVLLFGLVPASRTARADLQSQLREGARGDASTGRRRLRQGLVVGEVTLSVLLLVVSGLLVRSFRNLVAVDPGFEADKVLALSVSLPGERYGTPEERLRFYERVAESVAALPGVESAAFVNTLPFSTSNNGTRFVIDGEPMPAPSEMPSSDFRVVSPGYLEALRIPVLQGRDLSPADREGAARVAIVNRALVQRHFPDESPLGRRIRLGSDTESPWYEIVGVTGSVLHWALSGTPQPEIYVALAQQPPSNMSLAVRTAEPPEQIVNLVRGEIRRIDPQQPIFHVKPLETMVADSHLSQTAALVMITVFASMALLLASLGLYGVISYSVSQSTREMGVRMALGAQPFNLLGQVLREGMSLVAVGLVLGLAGAWGLTGLLSSQLYGISPYDPAAYAVALSLLAAVALLACLVPARRATRIDPVVALRAE